MGGSQVGFRAVIFYLVDCFVAGQKPPESSRSQHVIVGIWAQESPRRFVNVLNEDQVIIPALT